MISTLSFTDNYTIEVYKFSIYIVIYIRFGWTGNLTINYIPIYPLGKL